VSLNGMEIRNKTIDDSDTVNGSGSSMLGCEWRSSDVLTGRSFHCLATRHTSSHVTSRSVECLLLIIASLWSQ